MKDITSMELSELTELMREMGEPAFRAKQIYSWLHVHLVKSFGEMSNLPLSLREKLEKLPFAGLETVKVQTSALDGTKKYLFALPDGNLIESVLMRYHHGNSVCISSQVGCRMGCRFCASTIGGLIRSLTPGEMLGQIYAISRDCGERVSNVVVMGSGEPLDNYENLLVFIRMLSDENGLHISQRNITVSTCGLVPGIYALAKEKLSITLALSLHAPNDEKRRALMPVARRYPLSEVIAAAKDYTDRTGRRLTAEYALIAGQNDSERDARELSVLLRPLHAHVNLIPVNPVRERSFVRPERKAAEQFKKKLENCGINVTIRREMGSDIDGACGQLRAGYLSERT